MYSSCSFHLQGQDVRQEVVSELGSPHQENRWLAHLATSFSRENSRISLDESFTCRTKDERVWTQNCDTFCLLLALVEAFSGDWLRFLLPDGLLCGEALLFLFDEDKSTEIIQLVRFN